MKSFHTAYLKYRVLKETCNVKGTIRRNSFTLAYLENIQPTCCMSCVSLPVFQSLNKINIQDRIKFIVVDLQRFSWLMVL